jgi:hypothetical protein
MEPAHRVRVPRPEEAVAGAILKVASLDRKTRAAWDPAAAAAGAVVKVAVKAVENADSNLNH